MLAQETRIHKKNEIAEVADKLLGTDIEPCVPSKMRNHPHFMGYSLEFNGLIQINLKVVASLRRLARIHQNGEVRLPRTNLP
jgi:hypothetical protein